MIFVKTSIPIQNNMQYSDMSKILDKHHSSFLYDCSFTLQTYATINKNKKFWEEFIAPPSLLYEEENQFPNT
jgi:hypothetical protein